MRSITRTSLLTLLILAALVVAGCGSATAPSTGLSASGTIEADIVYVAPESAGKIAELLVDKGDTVAAGDVLARLDAELFIAQRDQAQGALGQAEGALAAAEAQLAKARAGARPEEIASAEAAVAAAVASAQAAAANVSAAQGQLETARAGVDAAQAQMDKADTGATAEELAIAEHAVEAAKNALWSVQAQRDAVCGRVGRGATEADCDAGDAATQQAEEEVRIAELQLQQVRNGARTEDLAATQAGLAQAQAGARTAEANLSAAQSALDLATAQQAQAQAQLDLLRAGSREEDVALLEAQVAQARAAADAAEATLRSTQIALDRLTLTAPSAGVVTARTGEVGELASAGVPVYALADLGSLTLTVYIPEADLGGVALGQEARVAVDAYSQSFAGRVTYIASQAEFTPKNVELKEERVNMVFAVEITLDNPDGLLLPGMPADVTFGVRPSATPITTPAA